MSEKIQVKRKIIGGIQYLFNPDDNRVYDEDSMQLIGFYDPKTKTITPDEEEEDEEEEEDDEGPDENEGLYYLNKSTDFFYNQLREVTKADGITGYVATFDTGIRLNSFMSEDIVNFNNGALRFGLPVFIETNGLARIIGGGDNYYSIKFINKNGEEVDRRIRGDKEHIGIYNGEAFVALFGYDKKHTTLETYNNRIVNAFRDYIIPKILFEKPEYIPKITIKPSKLPVLEKALEEETKNLENETDPKKQKVIKSLMKKLISEIPKAKKFDEDQQAKLENIELIKERNGQLLAEQRRIKKELKLREDEAKRIQLEARTKAQEEARAKAAEDKRKADEREQLKQKRTQYKSLDETRDKFNRIAYTSEYVANDPEKPNVRNRIVVMKTEVLIDDWVKVKDMLNSLPVEDVDWYYELKAEMERFLENSKENALINAFKRYSDYKSQISNPTRWEGGGDNETKKGIKKRDEFVEEATKKKLAIEEIIRSNFTKAEREKAIATINTKKGKGIDNPALYEKAKLIADNLYAKPSAYKSGFIVKTYKELGGTYSGEKPNTTGISRWFKEDWKDIGNKEYPVYRPTKRVTKDTPLTPDEIKPSNLKKQIALKQEIKGNKNLPPFVKSGTGIEKETEILKYSNPKKVLEHAIKYFDKNVKISISDKKDKKYMVYNPTTNKWVHFGQMGYEDFTKHQDKDRRKNYLTRTANMRGNWKDDKYSANNLSRNLLW